MTGYGKCEKQTDNVCLSLELRTLNSRFIDFSHRLPKVLLPFEDDALKLIKKKCIRGRIILSVKIDYIGNEKNNFVINHGKLENYMELIEEIQNTTSITSPVSLSEILNFPDIINNDINNDDSKLKIIFLDSLNEAIDENDKSRILEGKNIKEDLIDRINGMGKIISNIESYLKNNHIEYFDKYKLKINELLNDIELDENRAYQEIAIIMEKKDITEEIVRFNSHVNLFEKFMNSNENEGKKLNFLLQEMGREVNTMGSKTDIIEVSHMVVQLKDEIEKIREQVQNII
ncbi:MAG: YicC family protein [Pelagibacteraceae bacterium]|nr:YicC family protein [Pelagibacteraceae bacterium]